MQFIDYLTAMMTLSMTINLEAMYMSYRLGSGAARDELKSIGLVMAMLGSPNHNIWINHVNYLAASRLI